MRFAYISVTNRINVSDIMAAVIISTVYEYRTRAAAGICPNLFLQETQIYEMHTSL